MAEDALTNVSLNKNKRYRKDKPWDNDSIDHWKTEEFKKGDMPHPLLEESSFAVLFPKYREKYLQEVLPVITEKLNYYGIVVELNLIEGSILVKTTRKVWDPYAIVKARDLIKLLSRGVPVAQSLKIMQDDVACDIIKIGNIVRVQDRFVKRRQRLIGPNGATLRAIELLTNCYVLVQGSTVAAMGDYKGLKWVRKIVLDCMKNIHPIYNIKELMIRRQLLKDPVLSKEDWSRFLPKYVKRHGKKRHIQIKKRKGEIFPEPPKPRKVDIELETGEYWLKKSQKKSKGLIEKEAKQKQAKLDRAAAREKHFVPPKEVSNDEVKDESKDIDTNKIVAKLKKNLKKRPHSSTN